MRTAIGATILLAFAALCLNAQAPVEPASDQRAQAPPSNLGDILTHIQQTTSSASVNIGKLRIEKWKTDSDQKQQLQQIAGSLQKNIANAVPGLINDVQNSHGSVAASFKLYHNLNVVYENLSYLADVAGGLGKKEEFEPLAADAAALESARSNLSDYIEQSAVKMEAANRAATAPAAQARQNGAPVQVVPGQKVVVVNEDDPPQKAKPAAKSGAKSTKKKTSTVDTKKVSAPATPTPTPSATSPH